MFTVEGCAGCVCDAVLIDAQRYSQKLWQHLDELAENDPEGYKAFLEKQAKAAGVDLNSKDKPAPKVRRRPTLAQRRSRSALTYPRGAALTASPVSGASPLHLPQGAATSAGSTPRLHSPQAAVVVTSDLDDVRKAGATPGAEESPGSRAVVEIWVDTTGEVGPATLAGAPFDHAAPAADLSQLRVPLAPAGEPRDRQHGALGPGGRGRVLPCRAHPEIVRGAALDTAVRLALVEAAFQFWEGRGFALSRRGRKAFVDASCLPPSQRSHAESRARAAREADVRQAASSVGADLPEGLVRDLASMSVG